MKAAADRYIPQGAQPVEHPEGLGIVYAYTGKRPGAIAYGGQRSKADWHYVFSSEAQRQKEIDAYFARLSSSAKMKQERNEERAQPHSLEVGQIVYNTWGYDQTNVDFYQITRVSAHFVWLRRIGATVTETGFMCGDTVPKPNCFVKDSPEEKHKVYTYRDEPAICFEFGAGSVHKDGQRHCCSWYA